MMLVVVGGWEGGRGWWWYGWEGSWGFEGWSVGMRGEGGGGDN